MKDFADASYGHTSLLKQIPQANLPATVLWKIAAASRRFVSVVILLLSGLSGTTYGQKIVNGLSGGSNSRLEPSDLAAFNSEVSRNDMPCSVEPIRPKLGFDFVFHSGFHVEIPYKDLITTELGNSLTILFRVSAQNPPATPVYMVQKVRVPPMDANLSGLGTVDGSFILGEGKYHVDWLLRDLTGRVCSKSWDIDAKPGSRELPLRAWLTQGIVEPEDTNPFKEEPPVLHDRDGGHLSVDIIINFAPRTRYSTVLDLGDLSGVTAILRRIVRDPRIRSHSIVACSLPVQKELYSQGGSLRIDLPGIGDALKVLNFGVVDAKQLASKDKVDHFVADVIRRHANSSDSDALILVGTKGSDEPKARREMVDSLKNLRRPVFYLSFTADPLTYPWRDVLANAVKESHGFAYEIGQPRDLFNAWSDIVSRIASVKH